MAHEEFITRMSQLTYTDEKISADVYKIARKEPISGATGLVITEEGLVLVDTGFLREGPERIKSIRQYSDKPIHTLIYTHGHGDHWGGGAAFIEDAARRGDPRPKVIAHENFLKRIEKYRLLKGRRFYISTLQRMTIDPNPVETAKKQAQMQALMEKMTVMPDITFAKNYSFKLGGLTFELYYAPGETDDTIWLWVPERKLAIIGDLFIGSVPNTGNPLKEQRYTIEWAEALDQIVAKKPENIITAVGVLPGEIGHEVLSVTARFLRYIHDEVVQLLNEGKWIEEILDIIKIPDEFKQCPWLGGGYGHTAFIIHDVYRKYTGWFDGNPTDLFPVKSSAVMTELLKFANSAALIRHARALQKENHTQLALHVIDVVVKGSQNTAELKEALTLKAELLDTRAKEVSNYIASNIMRSNAVLLRDRAQKLS